MAVVEPAAASTSVFATVDMPFDGTWAKVAGAHPSVHHAPAGGDWAADIYALPGTAVRLFNHSAPGVATYKVLQRTFTCPNSSGGTRLRLEVSVGGEVLGWVEYQHLDEVTAAVGDAVPPGAVLGTTRRWAFIGGCWEVGNDEGVHTHVEVKGTNGDSCLVDREVNFSVAAGKPVGYLGGGFGVGARSRCPIAFVSPHQFDGSSTWNEYGPAFEGSPQIADFGATHTHAFGRSVGSLSYNFDSPRRARLQGLVRVTARLSSEVPFYSAPSTAMSDVVLVVNGAQAGTARVVADNGSGREYSWLVNAARFPIGQNRVAFAVESRGAVRNGICIYEHALVPGQFDAAIEIDFTLRSDLTYFA